MRTPFVLLLVLLLVQGAQALVTHGNPVIVGIGALSYLAPLPALFAGYHFALKRGRTGIEGWLAWYLVAALIMLPSVVLEYAGFELRVLGDIGESFRFFQEDSNLTSNAGFFRASEMAAWHTATAVCVMLLLSSMRDISVRRMIAVIGIVVGPLAIGSLTGRRKIFVEIAIFISVYVSLVALFGKGGVRLAVGVLVGGLPSYVLAILLVDDQRFILVGRDAAPLQRYAERSVTVARLAYGLVAFLVANLSVFFVATQLFGDLFVLLILGLVAGFFLATPVLAEREQTQRSAAQVPAPSRRPMVVPGTQLLRR